MKKVDYEGFDVEANSRLAEEVMADAYARKRKSKSLKPESLNRTLKQANGAEVVRRRKLDYFSAFLDAFQARGPSVEEEDQIRSTLLGIYAARGKSPYDMAMWLLRQRELEDRGLFHLLPDTEQGNIEGASL